jgi:hypothetical protein
MFNRKNKQTWGQRLKGLLWPTMGWRRMSQYLKHRIGRLQGTPYAIAAGFACGAAISFTPFVGLHFALGAVWAWLIRANILASAIGTIVGNPWSFPFIWVWIYRLGRWMGVGEGDPSAENIHVNIPFGSMLDAAVSGNFELLVDTMQPVFLPMLMGGVPSAAVVWIISYILLKRGVSRYQKNRRRRRAR